MAKQILNLENLAKLNTKDTLVLSQYFNEHQIEILNLLNEAYNTDQALFLVYDLLTTVDKTDAEKVELALALLEQNRPGVATRQKRNPEIA